MLKNTAGQRIGAQLISTTDGSAFTGAATVYVTIDAGTQTIGSVGSGICTHEGNGYHTYAPSQAETNGDLIAFTFVGSGAITSTVQVYTVDLELAAGKVWDVLYSQHTTEGTFGKLMDILRKANYTTDGTVIAGATPTTTTFRTDLTQPDDTYDHQTLLFLSGNLEGESKPILSYSQTNGEITLDEALTEAPVAGDEFVILPHHVHPLSIMVSRIFANEVEAGGYTLTRTLQAIGSMLAGLVSGAGSGTESFKAIGNSAKTRVQFLVDDDGNRTGVTYDWS